jgi:hypothetical protein
LFNGIIINQHPMRWRFKIIKLALARRPSEGTYRNGCDEDGQR